MCEVRGAPTPDGWVRQLSPLKEKRLPQLHAGGLTLLGPACLDTVDPSTSASSRKPPTCTDPFSYRLCWTHGLTLGTPMSLYPCSRQVRLWLGPPAYAPVPPPPSFAVLPGADSFLFPGLDFPSSVLPAWHSRALSSCRHQTLPTPKWSPGYSPPPGQGCTSSQEAGRGCFSCSPLTPASLLALQASAGDPEPSPPFWGRVPHLRHGSPARCGTVSHKGPTRAGAASWAGQ